MDTRVASALREAEHARQGAQLAPERWSAEPAQLVAIGDPQTTAAQFFEVLAGRGLLRDDGLLVDEATLVSMGDHFDFGRTADRAAARSVGREGMRILAWLAAHPPERTRILLGNHDTVRVTELIALSDETFQAARDLALRIEALASTDAAQGRLLERFGEEFPQIPTPESARRDFSAYASEQRDLLVRLLLDRRVQLATTGHHADGRPVLLTHAGVTARELEHLQPHADAEAGTLADALNQRLAQAVDTVADDWRRARWTPLDLAPLARPGGGGREGSGLLFHRPANPQVPSLRDRQHEFDEASPRRFHPAALPAGLLQAVGHTRHGKLLEELTPWHAEDIHSASPASLRTLCVGEGEIRYRPGAQPPAEGHAAMHMLDVDMHRQDPRACEVLRLRVG